VNDVTAPARAADQEEQSNPFSADGELRRKAEFIITHSRISRTEIQITDPDVTSAETTTTVDEEEAKQVTFDVPDIVVPTPNGDSPAVEQPQQPPQQQQQLAVQTDAIVGSTSAPSPSSAEKVKLRKKRCSVQ